MRFKGLFFIVLFMWFLPNEVGAEVKIDSLKTSSNIVIEEGEDSLDITFNKKNNKVDYYYVNICERSEETKKQKGCYKNYYSLILPDRDVIKMPVKKEGFYTYALLSVNKDKTITSISEVNFEFTNPTYLSSSFIVDTENVRVNELLETKFKGYENWSTSEKSRRIHQYIVNNYDYDYDILETEVFKRGQVHPDYDRVITHKKGICYDLASLYTSLLRLMGVPASISIGYATEGSVTGYHAWVTVEIDGEERIIDPTWDLLTNNYNYRIPSNYVEEYRY